MKVYLYIYLLLVSLTTFGQSKLSQEKVMTNGEELYLQYVDAHITPPAGYIFMEDYSSFLDQKTQTSISVVKDERMSYQAFVDNMLKKDYTIGNAELLSHEKVEKGYLFTFLFRINNLPVERVVFVTGTENFCYWVTANYKQKEKEKYAKLLKETLYSIRYK